MKKITARSLMDIRFLSNPQISPDGAHTAYVVNRQNEAENSYESWIYLMENATGEIRRMTHSGKESDFIWESADALLFPAVRGKADKPKEFVEKTCYYRLNIRGGEAEKAFELPLNATALRPMDGGKFAVNALVDLNATDDGMDETLRRDEKDYHVLEEVPFWSNGRGYVSRLRSALFVFDPADDSLVKISDDDFNVADFDARGDRIAYVGCAYRDKMDTLSAAKLHRVSTGETMDMIPQDTYHADGVLLTARGALLSLSDLKPWGIGQMRDLYRYDATAGTLSLAQKMDMPIGGGAMTDCAYGGGQRWTAVGDEVYFIGQRAYRSEIYRLRADDRLEKAAAFDGCVSMLDADGKNLVFAAQAPNRCGDLYILQGGAAVRRTDLNADFFREYFVAQAEHIPFTNSDGVAIDGWILKPEGFDDMSFCAGVLEIHGGPRCTYGEVFFHEMQALVGEGYAVFFCNPRGSEGYGEAFADLRGRYGTVDYQDLMEFTDHVLARYPQITRIGAAGGSYGGFMCNWIEGHTDRFSAIVSQRSISNWVADFGASEIGFTFDQNEMGANPWTDMEKMWAQSPLKYACNAKTPILFIHSLCDYNCTVDQGVEMFAAMKYFGVPSRMCLFEGENHSLSRSGKPRHRLRRLTEILNWFAKYLKDA